MKTMWFWNSQVGPWRCWGLWYEQRWFAGLSIVRKGEEWKL
jgi:hypothetical protein